jgi:hypothetical protein
MIDIHAMQDDMFWNGLETPSPVGRELFPSFCSQATNDFCVLKDQGTGHAFVVEDVMLAGTLSSYEVVESWVY